ncbi:uncharacterized protein KY384_002087 [Bacidia gigantensis]|uniref:uncharacterized protein n=1 Tax=Bacidia gigantensis TaxID=2732470 RepID=UPI001D04F863|nr:uncharacterized protein KY384_002087 [Bacidia gigantensis]KAG8533304.1 hypothetical protein KY384_002087 [Bacidia gigantensis]
MGDDQLSIRNLTSNHIRVEKYEIHERVDGARNGNKVISASKNATSAFVTAKPHELVSKEMQTISVLLDPSTFRKVPVKRAKLPSQILCIFFEINDNKYQSNIIHARTHTQYLMSVDGNPDPPCKHITIYHPEQHHLVIAFRESYKSWMGSIRDDVPLSALSIPGTHNSPTYHHALPSVRCQSVPVIEQLRKGVRFLDVRVQPEHHKIPLKDEMILVHSIFPISLTGPRHFRPLVREVLQFLEANPSETVIMSLKREGTGSSTDEHLSILLRENYASDPSKWFTAPRIPYLGEVRGKIVLIRRFGLDPSLQEEWGGNGWGIDADAWADNSPHAVCPSGDICFQDFYEVLKPENIAQKIQYSVEHLQRASTNTFIRASDSASTTQPFYINFLTASNFWKMKCWPYWISTKLNPAIVEHLCLNHNKIEDETITTGDGSTGIVVCDWVGYRGNWDIVRCIVGMNSKFEKPR